MNKEMQQLLHTIQVAQDVCDEKFFEYEAGYQALTDAKAMKYDVQDNEAGEKIVTPISAVMKEIEAESSFESTAKTKDERYQQLRKHLLDTNSLYAECNRILERAELELINATRLRDVGEKNYGRIHTKLWGFRLEGESTLRDVETRNLHTRDETVIKEAENLVQQIEIEMQRAKNLDKELTLETARMRRVEIERETAGLQLATTEASGHIAAIRDCGDCDYRGTREAEKEEKG